MIEVVLRDYPFTRQFATGVHSLLSSGRSTEEADGDEGDSELPEPPLEDEVGGVALFTTTRAETSFVEDDPT